MSVKEDILTNLVSTLEGITTGNGYNLTVESVVPYPLHSTEIDQSLLPTISIVSGREEVSYHLENRVDSKWTVGFRGFLDWSDASSGTGRADVHSLLEDIQKALFQDPTRGGNAVNTTVLSADPPFIWAGGGGTGLADLTAMIHYRRTL